MNSLAKLLEAALFASPRPIPVDELAHLDREADTEAVLAALEELRGRESTNFAHVHPDDVAMLGVSEGAIVRIASPRGAIRGIVKAERNIKQGTVSMAHAWGGVPDDDLDLSIHGSTTAMLIDNTSGYDKFSGIPVMSAIPVSVTAE